MGKSGFNGILDEGSHIKGELHFEDTFKISGKITGSVVSSGDLEVYEAGEVDGEIRVRHILISGTVRGTLRASARVEINSTGKVTADIHTPTLVIKEGAFFEGRCSMRGEREGSAAEATGNVAQLSLAKKRR